MSLIFVNLSNSGPLSVILLLLHSENDMQKKLELSLADATEAVFYLDISWKAPPTSDKVSSLSQSAPVQHVSNVFTTL